MTRRAMTLVEMVISLAILTVVLTGAMCAVLLGGRALQVASDQTNPAATAEAMTEILADLRTATSFSERTDTAVTFSVPDRNGDGSGEIIRYEWSGEPGDALYRQYNAEPPVLVADDVQEFNLDFLTETVEATGPTEDILIQHVDMPGGSLKSVEIGTSSWAGTYFKPTLPPGATGWRITRIALYVKRRNGAASKPIWLKLAYADSHQKPGTNVLETLPIVSANLSSGYAWEEFSFSNQTFLSPDQGMCLVIGQDVNGKSAVFRYEGGSSQMTPDAHYLTSNDRGWHWSIQSGYDLLFKVYGEVRTQ